MPRTRTQVRCKTKVELPKCVSLSSLNTETWTCSQTYWQAQSSCVSGKRGSEEEVTNTTNLSTDVIQGARHLLLLEDTMARLVWRGSVVSSDSKDTESRVFSLAHLHEHSHWLKLRFVWRHHVEEARSYARLSVLLEMFRRCMGQMFWNRNAKSLRRRTNLLNKLSREIRIVSDPEMKKRLSVLSKGRKKGSYKDAAIPVVPIAVPPHLQDELSFEEAFLRLNPQYKTKRRPRAGGKTIDLHSTYILFLFSLRKCLNNTNLRNHRTLSDRL